MLNTLGMAQLGTRKKAPETGLMEAGQFGARF